MLRPLASAGQRFVNTRVAVVACPDGIADLIPFLANFCAVDQRRHWSTTLRTVFSQYPDL